MTVSKNMYLFTQTAAVVALLAALKLSLLPALLAGLLVYFLVEFGTRMLGKYFGVIQSRGRLILVALLSVVLLVLLGWGVLSAMAYVSEGPESLVVLFQRMADSVAAAREQMPRWIADHMPVSVEEWQSTAVDWLRQNASEFRIFGAEVGYFFGHMIFGMIIGGMIAIRPAFQKINGPLAQALSDRVDCLSTAFRRIVFSQIRISALNTFFTGVFLVFVMPAMGYDLPLAKTMIAVTFIAGLLPIIGNIISNTVITLIALSVTPMAAVAALVFLVLIHKLEYFFNATIIGTQIKARAWEILLAMLVMQAAFGVVGIVAAPIYYAYIKDELTAQRLI